LRKALEKLEADHTVLHHVSRATSHLWLAAPLRDDGDDKHAKLNKLFDTHPPIAERIAILRTLEGLNPDQRGPVDETSTGVPVDLAALAQSTDRRTATAAALLGAPSGVSPTPQSGEHPPGWYQEGDNLHYWDGTQWTDWQATWNGSRWVQARLPGA
jgi:hypothetical protein